MSILSESETVAEMAALGIRAFTTTRESGNFGLQTDDPVRDVMARWSALRNELAGGSAEARFATVTQVHGAEIVVHRPGWDGWLRAPRADGQMSVERGTALAVTIADCVPVFIAHAGGAVALLHSGWRGTAARIIERGIDAFRMRGIDPAELSIHLGPAICGKCYEVSPEVYAQLAGTTPDKPTTIDLRSVIAAHARESGVERVTASASCTRCDNPRFFSHRAGDAGRQVSVIVAD